VDAAPGEAVLEAPGRKKNATTTAAINSDPTIKTLFGTQIPPAWIVKVCERDSSIATLGFAAHLEIRRVASFTNRRAVVAAQKHDRCYNKGRLEQHRYWPLGVKSHMMKSAFSFMRSR
jgi:hypothetical protein